MVNMSLNWSQNEAAIEGADEAGREGVGRLNLREPCGDHHGFLWNKMKEAQRQTNETDNKD